MNPIAYHRQILWGALLFGVLVDVAHAGPRTSASYSITNDTADSGGLHATSAVYSSDGSAGGIGGTSTVNTPVEFAKSGYIGQLYVINGLALNSSSLMLNETTGTAQLNASQTLDDSSTIALMANTVTWSVVGGPIASISAGGLVAAGTVYQDTSATVQGVYLGRSGTLNLTVHNVNDDDFGLYANDGLPDSWQVQYFGLNNPHAAPGAVSDGSGLTNLFKYTAGLIPGDAGSTFSVNVSAVPNQPGQFNIVISPSLTTLTYTVQSSTDLIHWDTLAGPFSGNGSTQTVTDPSAGGSQKFYRVQINHP